MMIGLILISIFGNVFESVNAISQNSESVSVNDQAINAFFRSNEYVKIKDSLVSETPQVIKPLYDDDGHQNGISLIFSVKTDTKQSFDENKVKGTYTAKVESPLLAVYNLKDKKITTVDLFDYSYLATEDKNIKVTDLSDDSVMYLKPNEVTDNTNEFSRNLNKDIDKTVDNATEKINSNNGIASRVTKSCSIFECTKYKKYGGYSNEGCSTIGNMVCAGVSGKWRSVVCAGAVAVACYVPKGKLCVKGRWYHSNVCPI
ncbi:hypothetical protein [Lactobacillus sp. ESL0681]|uniref:hypothetical protein n=1 Tax=Lactobacillus sp. ESL0681 TaxID=2983211 RepID=UPI0023FA41C0|nr:hypothetical protein [Lactobacillus sp. ESL0681]WEV39924.1 hypothetical protein OZX59_06850 [Lactobacillus sp. ESL0681]